MRYLFDVIPQSKSTFHSNLGRNESSLNVIEKV